MKQKKVEIIKPGEKVEVTEKSSKRRPSYLQTQYDIPHFSYRSAIVITLISLAAVLVILFVTRALNVDSKKWIVIGLPIAFGLGVTLSQYKIEHKRGYTKGFFMTWIGIAIIGAIFLSVVPF